MSRARDMMKMMMKPWRNDILNTLHDDWCDKFIRRRNQGRKRILSALQKHLTALKIPYFQSIGEERLLHKLKALKETYWSIINCTKRKPMRKDQEEEVLTDLRNISYLVTHHYNQNVIHQIEKLTEQVRPLRSKCIPYGLFKLICEALGSVIAPEMEAIESILKSASLYVSSLSNAKKTTTKCLERGNVELERDDMEKQNEKAKMIKDNSSKGEDSEGPQDCKLPKLQEELSQEMEDGQIEDHTVSEEIRNQVCANGTSQTKWKNNNVKKGKFWKCRKKKVKSPKGRNTVAPGKVNYLFHKEGKAKKKQKKYLVNNDTQGHPFAKIGYRSKKGKKY